MRGSRLFVLVPLLLAVPSLAAADESQERAAQKACLTGDASKGTEILADLYLDTKNPIYIFNQGRCYEQNERYEEAIGRFREYLRKVRNVSAADRVDTEKHIADCEELQARRQQANAATTAPTPAASPAGTVAVPAEVVTTVVQTPPAETSPGRGLRIAGVLAGAAGAAALVTGVVLNLKANSLMDDVNEHFNKDTYSQAGTYETLTYVSYGVGGVCIASGVVLYLVGRAAGSPPSVALVPTFTGGAAGATLTGSF